MHPALVWPARHSRRASALPTRTGDSGGRPFACGRITPMNPVVEFIKEFLIPGSAWFLLIAASACALLLFGAERRRRFARALLAGVVVLYWVISIPLVADALQKAQRSRPSGPTARLPDTPLPIVVLGNGVEGYSALGGYIELPGGRTAM